MVLISTTGGLDSPVMGKAPTDLEECYQILGVSPNAGTEEINLAFALNRRDLEAAGYDVRAIRQLLGEGRVQALKVPGVSALKRRRARRTSLNAPTLAAVLFGLMVVVLYVFVWPQYGYKLRHFRKNDVLVEERTGAPYATILEVSNAHQFANGEVAPAYRLKLARGGDEVWYPVDDVRRLCVRD